MNIDDIIHGISTLIEVHAQGGSSKGTGLFYQELSPKDPSKEGQWREITELWLVTNRHVLLPRVNNAETTPTQLTFNLRKESGNKVVWDPIVLGFEELADRARLHPNPGVDVCAIRILDLLTERLKSGEKYLNWYGVSAENLAGQNKINPHVGSKAMVVGYPRGFYDHVNVFPIVKSGIVATRWSAKFEGNPYFLIYAKLFPGSSGSIVISEPKNIAVENGQLLYAKEEQFAFLGIYSGELYQIHTPIEFDDLTIIRKSGFNVGVVWYGYLVDEIISGTVALAKP